MRPARLGVGRERISLPATHPETGAPWPAIPPSPPRRSGRAFGRRPARARGLPGQFLRRGCGMGLHQDRDESIRGAGPRRVSLGDTCLFRIGGTSRGGADAVLAPGLGDVLAARAARARLAFHGVDRLYPGTSTLLQGGRAHQSDARGVRGAQARPGLRGLIGPGHGVARLRLMRWAAGASGGRRPQWHGQAGLGLSTPRRRGALAFLGLSRPGVCRHEMPSTDAPARGRGSACSGDIPLPAACRKVPGLREARPSTLCPSPLSHVVRCDAGPMRASEGRIRGLGKSGIRIGEIF